MKRLILSSLLACISILIGQINAIDVKYTVPEGASIANVFAALYGRARVLGMGVYAPNSGRRLVSADNAMQVFVAYCHDGYCDYVRGKCMKVDLSSFPKINLKEYNRQYGNNAGQEAIENYIASQSKIDREEKYQKVPSTCGLFEQNILQSMAHEDWVDMEEQKQTCIEMEKSLQGLFSQIEQTRDAFKGCSDCRVNYIITSEPINRIPHSNKKLSKAHRHMRMLNNSRYNRNDKIRKLEVSCRQNNAKITADVLSVGEAEAALSRIVEISQ